MPRKNQKKQKISDLTSHDATSLLLSLIEFRSNLDEDDKDLPAALISSLEQMRQKLEVVTRTSFSKVDSTALTQLQIDLGPLVLIPGKAEELRALGSTETESNWLTVDATKKLIRLVKSHVSTITEAGCRIMIGIILLRIASSMSDSDTAVHVIPEFPIPKTTFSRHGTDASFGGLVDFLLTKLPARYSDYLLGDPLTAIAKPRHIGGPLTSNIFEAKRNNVRDALPRAIMAAASYCQQHGLEAVRGAVTSGEQWLFFVYRMTMDGGRTVSYTTQFELGSNLEGLLLILGILCDWVNHSTESEQLFFES